MQPSPEGLAQAFEIETKFLDNAQGALVLSNSTAMP
jgi:dTDP-glucose pyrophosphorylase